MPYQIVYASSATRAMTSEDLADLLEQAREKNERLDVTGMLIYFDGAFLQALEGAKDVVEALYKTIESDDRHEHVTTLRASDAEAREFTDWSMGFRDLSDMESADVLEGLPAARDLGDGTTTLDTLSDNPGHAAETLRRFSRQQRSTAT